MSDHIDVATELSLAPHSVWAFYAYFLRLGAAGFGGPIALAGFMQRDLVESRRWISAEDYRDGLALAQLAPGPLAAQLAMYLGYVRGGMVGATIVSFCFILPSFLMVWAISVAYVRFGGLPWMQALFYGIGAAVIGIIARSATKLTKLTLQGRAGVVYALARYAVAAGRDDARGGSLASGLGAACISVGVDHGWIREGHLSGQVGWCNGLAGLMLAGSYLQTLAGSTSSQPELGEEVLRLLPRVSCPSLCHGRAGLVDVAIDLLGTTEKGRRQIRSSARAALAHRGRVVGGHTVFSLPSVGLLLGTTGIGFALLRCAEPSVPSVLSLSSPAHGPLGG